jgi:predicted nucleic acid-binding protein
VTAVVVDTSVLLKWFHSSGEAEVIESRAVLAAHVDEVVTAHIVDLGVYELGNVLLRSLNWSADDVADQLDDLLVICGPPLVSTPSWLRVAAGVAEQHRLTYYDAMFVAAAHASEAVLISADRDLLAAGLAESPTEFTRRLGLLDR